MKGRWAGILWLAMLPMGPKANRFEFRQTHMGSEFKILLYTTTEADARRASDLAFARIAELDRTLSDYNPDSELMMLCDKSGGPPVAVSDDLFRCLERGQAMAERSGGAFDVTIGPVVRLWRRSRRTRKLPDPDTLAKARDLVGYRKLKLDREHRTAELVQPGMKLDLGGLAKGFAADEAIATLKKAGVSSALVAGAGDIVVSDPPPDSEGWTIMIADPDGGPDHPTRSLHLCNAAVSTAGDSEQFLEIGGNRYAHVVDPRTGIGLQSRASVTVVARDGLSSDSLDTTIYVLGQEQGLKFIDKFPQTAALFVTAGEKPQVGTSSRWKAIVEEYRGRERK